jgi:acetylornithine deacetylase/succinyl-diaminopimelate desuccinylase-like protein
MANLYRAVATYIDKHRDELRDLLAALIACRTDSQSEHNPDFRGEARRCQELVRSELSKYMSRVETWDEDEMYPVTAGLMPGGEGPSLALNGHLDVVPVGAAADWFSDPWELTERNGKLYGRGTADMKGGVAAALFALRAIDACSVTPPGDTWVHLVSDEEIVGQSTRRLLERMPRPDAVIDMEPSELSIMPTEGGLIHLRVEVQGIETHAGNRHTLLYPGPQAAGVSAVEKLLRLVVALQDLERAWAKKPQHPLLPPGFNTILPALIVGGPGGGRDGRLNLYSNAGTVSNYASVEYNLWYLPNETFERVRDEVEQYIHHVCQLDPWLREHPPVLTWKLNGIFFPPVDTATDHPLLASIADGLSAVGRDAPVRGFGAASELAWYAEHDIPGVLFGPGSVAQAHSPQEHVAADQLVDAAKVLAYAILTPRQRYRRT